MEYDVVVEIAQPELVAATRATIPLGDIPRTWKPALDRVWAFLKTRRDLDPGHNLFLYHHSAHRHEAMDIDFGVQVVRPFKPERERWRRRFTLVPTIDWPTPTTQSTLGASRTTGKSRRLRGKPTATGPRTRLSSKRRSGIYWLDS